MMAAGHGATAGADGGECIMTTPEPPDAGHSPGYETVWQAPDAGEQQAVVCPSCRVEIGTVGEKEERQLFCTHCQTVYRVRGSLDGPPEVERLYRRVVVEGEGTIGQALRGGQPDVPPRWAGAAAQAALWLLLLLLLGLVLWAL